MALVTLDNFQGNFGGKINSPRSIEAANRLGVDLNELYPRHGSDTSSFLLLICFLGFGRDISEFEQAGAVPEFVQMRFEHFERNRQVLIEQCKSERAHIMQESAAMSSSVDSSRVCSGV